MRKIKLQIDNVSKIFVALALLITVSQIGLILSTIRKLPPQVPLFYSLPWGENQLTSPQGLWWVPIICGVIVIVNLSVSVFLRQTVLTRILSSTSLLVSILALITLLKIIALEIT
jgi:hypothetical protein